MHNSQLENMISAPLSLWQEHHSIELRQQSENIFVVKDLEGLDFHLISFSHSQVDLANTVRLNLSVKKAQDCQTNLTVYLTAGVCFAIIDLDDLEVLSGQAKERETAVLIIEKADGWIDLIMEIKLGFPSPIYLGCSLGDQPVYEGCGKDQFYIQDSISIEILDLHLKYLRQVQDLVQYGELSEAIALYHSQIEQPLSDEQMYERIWKGLNELGIMPDDLIKNRKFNKEDTLKYFEQNSKYQTIFLSKKLSPELGKILQEVGLLQEYLTMILESMPGLEETYIKIKENLPDFSFARQQIRKKGFKWEHLNQDLDFQQSLVETGYLYIVCPFQGNIIKSNHSFIPITSEPHIIAYRFQSIEVFYLITGGAFGFKLCLYFPSKEVLICGSTAPKEWFYSSIINSLKGNFVSNFASVAKYISNSHIKNIVAITGVYGNLGHFWWNAVTGVDYLLNNELFSNVDKILLGSRCYFDVGKIFPEINSSKVISLQDNAIDLFTFCLDNNYILGYFTNMLMTSDVVDRICRASLEQVTPDFMTQVEEAKLHFPLIWINLRSHNRSWVSQVSGYIEIINKLVEIYPNLGIVFDGFPDEVNSLEQIQAGIPPSVKTYNALNCKIYESIVWSLAIDTYIAVIGSGLTLVTWIANKPGVAHGERGHLGQMAWWQQVQTNSILPLYPSDKDIRDVSSDPNTANYDCDWSIIYRLLLKILKTIPYEVDQSQNKTK